MSIGAGGSSYQSKTLQFGPAQSHLFSENSARKGTLLGMTRRKLIIRQFRTFIVGAALFLLSAQAEALRCGSRLVTEDMHISEVIAICGEPSHEDARTIVVQKNHPIAGHGPRRYRRNSQGLYTTPGYGPVYSEVVVRELTYNFGPRKLMRVLTFRNDYLSDIKHLGYGFREKR